MNLEEQIKFTESMLSVACKLVNMCTPELRPQCELEVRGYQAVLATLKSCRGE